MTNAHERASRELAAVQKSVDSREASVSQLEREKAALVSKVDELQAALEEETRQKLSHQGRARAAEAETDSVKEQLAEKEEELEASTRQAGVLRAQIDELKTKAAREGQAADEADNIRKKLQRDNEALSARVDELEQGKGKLHDTVVRLQSEAEDMTKLLETARNDAAAAIKKAKKADGQMAEARTQVAEAEGRAQAAEADASRLGAEVYTLKAQLEEALQEAAKYVFLPDFCCAA